MRKITQVSVSFSFFLSLSLFYSHTLNVFSIVRWICVALKNDNKRARKRKAKLFASFFITYLLWQWRISLNRFYIHPFVVTMNFFFTVFFICSKFLKQGEMRKNIPACNEKFSHDAAPMKFFLYMCVIYYYSCLQSNTQSSHARLHPSKAFFFFSNFQTIFFFPFSMNEWKNEWKVRGVEGREKETVAEVQYATCWQNFIRDILG